MTLDPPTEHMGNESAMRAQLCELSGRLDGFGDPGDRDSTLTLLRLLYETGRRDLPLARLFEGHVDALQIVTRYAEPMAARKLVAKARGGSTFGVWNAELPGEPLRRDGDAMTGGKSFASGAGILNHALVTIDATGGRQLLLVDLDAAPPAIDRDSWHVIGMDRSQTHIVRWSAASSAAFTAIGQPGDYVREPWFSGGALRFVASQAGGIAALCDHVRDHLVGTGRSADPHQLARIATLFDLADGAANVVRVAAYAWFDDAAARLPRVAAARIHTSAAADAALTVAQQAVGLAGMFDAHPLSAALTDLMVYLRQPAPDGAASHANSRLWPRERLVRARRDESRRAMRRLGVGAGAVTFLGLPDGGLESLSRLEDRTLARAIARRRTDLIVLPSAQDDHVDHRVVASVAAKVGARARRLEFCVWPARKRLRGAGVGLRLGVALAVKRQAIRAYRTQMGVITDDPAGFAISRAQLACFARPIEMFRVLAR